MLYYITAGGFRSCKRARNPRHRTHDIDRVRSAAVLPVDGVGPDGGAGLQGRQALRRLRETVRRVELRTCASQKIPFLSDQPNHSASIPRFPNNPGVLPALS